MAISDYEANRILEFFKNSPDNEKKLISIAKVLTKNTLTHLGLNDAFKIVSLNLNVPVQICNHFYFTFRLCFILIVFQAYSTENVSQKRYFSNT